MELPETRTGTVDKRERGERPLKRSIRYDLMAALPPPKAASLDLFLSVN
jgi:hypothetical protein